MMVGAQRTMKENEPRGQLSLSLLQGNNNDITVSFKNLLGLKLYLILRRKKKNTWRGQNLQKLNSAAVAITSPGC